MNAIPRFPDLGSPQKKVKETEYQGRVTVTSKQQLTDSGPSRETHLSMNIANPKIRELGRYQCAQPRQEVLPRFSSMDQISNVADSKTVGFAGADT